MGKVPTMGGSTLETKCRGSLHTQTKAEHFRTYFLSFDPKIRIFYIFYVCFIDVWTCSNSNTDYLYRFKTGAWLRGSSPPGVTSRGVEYQMQIDLTWQTYNINYYNYNKPLTAQTTHVVHTMVFQRTVVWLSKGRCNERSHLFNEYFRVLSQPHLKLESISVIRDI